MTNEKKRTPSAVDAIYGALEGFENASRVSAPPPEMSDDTDRAAPKTMRDAYEQAYAAWDRWRNYNDLPALLEPLEEALVTMGQILYAGPEGPWIESLRAAAGAGVSAAGMKAEKTATPGPVHAEVLKLLKERKDVFEAAHGKWNDTSADVELLAAAIAVIERIPSAPLVPGGPQLSEDTRTLCRACGWEGWWLSECLFTGGESGRLLCPVCNSREVYASEEARTRGEQVLQAIREYGEAECECGEWDRNESEARYEDVYQRARQAELRLRELLGLR